MNQEPSEKPVENAPKQVWESPEVKLIGHLHDILRAGGGKLSATPSDPGESRKASGSV